MRKEKRKEKEFNFYRENFGFLIFIEHFAKVMQAKLAKFRALFSQNVTEIADKNDTFLWNAGEISTFLIEYQRYFDVLNEIANKEMLVLLIFFPNVNGILAKFPTVWNDTLRTFLNTKRTEALSNQSKSRVAAKLFDDV